MKALIGPIWHLFLDIWDSIDWSERSTQIAAVAICLIGAGVTVLFCRSAEVAASLVYEPIELVGGILVIIGALGFLATATDSMDRWRGGGTGRGAK